jgi:uncharacterized caspase-like protein
MASWAVVIGIDRYAIADAALHGAVRDALRMREWLLDPDGGGLDEDHLVLVLGPADGAPDPGVPALAADHDNVIRAVYELVQRSGGVGDRLYFYYSGHGLSARQGFSDEDAIIFSDFEWMLPGKSLSLRSLWEYFAALRFDDQFLLVDACRNAPRVQDIRIGSWDRPKQRDIGTPPAQQFILYATSPGLRAAEIEELAGDERGAFTEALLEGLRGRGRAKLYDSAQDAYVVRWDSLTSFVIARMEARRQQVGQARDQELLQIPQQAGVRGVAGRSPNPVVATIPPKRVPDPNLSLDVRLAPDDVVAVAEVSVLDDAGIAVEEQTQLTALPVRFTLPPRTYLVHAVAPDYKKAACRPPVELYEDCAVSLALERAPAAAAAPAAEPPAGALGGLGGLGGLVATCTDPNLPIELHDAAGAVIATAAGRLETAQPPGAYRLVVRPPEGPALEQSVEVTAGTTREATLPVPEAEPVVADLAARTALAVHEGGALEVSEAVGPIGAASVSTVLSLAGIAALAGDDESGHRLRDLGAHAIREVLAGGATAALYALVGIAGDGAASVHLDDVRLSCWPFGARIPAETSTPRRLGAHPDLGECAIAAAPGEQWLALQRPGAQSEVMPVLVLDQRVTLVVVRLGADGGSQVFEFIPPCSVSADTDLPFARQVELLQRLAVTPWLYTAEPLARELVQGPTTPIASTLAAYTLLRLGHAGDLDDVSRRLTVDYPSLSDGHVIRVEVEAAAGRLDAAAAAIEAALDAGVPIFGEGLTRLLDGVAQFHNTHDRARVVSHVHERYVQGSLFSVWQPEELVPGRVLVPAPVPGG